MSGKHIYLSHVVDHKNQDYQQFVSGLKSVLINAGYTVLLSEETTDWHRDKLLAALTSSDGFVALLDFEYLISNQCVTEFGNWNGTPLTVRCGELMPDDRRTLMAHWKTQMESGVLNVEKPVLMQLMSAIGSARFIANELDVASVASSLVVAIGEIEETSAGAILGKTLGGNIEEVSDERSHESESNREEATRGGPGGVPPTPPPPPPETRPGTSDKVEFGIFTQEVIVPGDQFIVDVWAYLTSQYKEVVEMAKDMDMGKILKRKPGVSISTGAVVTVQLSIKKLNVEDPIDSFQWDGESTNVSFIVEVPEDARKGPYPGKVTIMIEGLPIARIPFIVKVESDQVEEVVQTQEVKTDIPRTAFASYASANRIEVERAIQGMQSILPELQVFLDVNNLRSGAGGWLPQLQKNVPTKDRFFLFWSAEAAASKWVRMEWELALSERGLDYIQPVPLIDPREAPPPPELGSLHFNDTHLAQIHYEKYIRSKRSET